MESASFTNDLASMITASANAAEEANASLASPPKRGRARPRGTASRAVAGHGGLPSAKRGRGKLRGSTVQPTAPVVPSSDKRKATPMQPTTSAMASATSLGKRRMDDSDSDSSEEGPFVAEPQMPPPSAIGTQERVGYKPSTVALGKRKEVAATSVSAAVRSTGASSQSSSRKGQQDDRRGMKTGSLSASGHQRAVDISIPPATAVGAKSKIASLSIPRKRRQQIQEERDDIAESSRSEIERNDERLRRRRQRSVSPERDERRKKTSHSTTDRHDTRHSTSRRSPEQDERRQTSFLPTNPMAMPAPQDYHAMMAASFNHIMMENASLRTQNATLIGQVQQLIENTRPQVVQQQDNTLQSATMLIQAVVPTMVQQSVDNTVYNAMGALLNMPQISALVSHIVFYVRNLADLDHR